MAGVAGVANLAGTFIVLAHSGWLAPFAIPSIIPYLLLYAWIAAVGMVLIRMPRNVTQPGSDASNAATPAGTPS
jgi:hypothetical protein